MERTPEVLDLRLLVVKPELMQDRRMQIVSLPQGYMLLDVNELIEIEEQPREAFEPLVVVGELSQRGCRASHRTSVPHDRKTAGWLVRCA